MRVVDLLNDLDVDYMRISSIRYDDNKGTSYFTDRMLEVGIYIANDEAIEISSGGKFIGAFDFKKYKTYRDENGIILEDKKLRYLEIYMK